MSPGNGQPKPLTPEQLAAQIAQQRMMAAAMQYQQRQAVATALLSGILSGLYTNPTDLVEHFGDRALNDAVAFADKLLERLNNDARASANPPQVVKTEAPLPGETKPAGEAQEPPTTPPAANG